MFKSIKEALVKTSKNIASGISNVLRGSVVDDKALDALFETLIRADLGTEKSEKIINKIRNIKKGTEDEIKNVISDEIASVFQASVRKVVVDKKPFVFLVVGINGNGKTTTIAKLAHFYKNKGLSVMVAACDTFRAAAVEQLNVWCNTIGVTLCSGAQGADSASVAYQALELCISEGKDVLLIDTAGRLHNRQDLIAELEKISRVIKKIIPEAPHEVLLLVDATTGQTNLLQTKVFFENVDVTGIVLTKLDGTAKGGVAVSIVEKFNLPILFVCYGETLLDIKEFNVNEYANSIIGQNYDTNNL